MRYVPEPPTVQYDTLLPAQQSALQVVSCLEAFQVMSRHLGAGSKAQLVALATAQVPLSAPSDDWFDALTRAVTLLIHPVEKA